MKRETGEKIIAIVKEMDAVLDKLGTASLEIEDDEERKKMRREIANLIVDAHLKITMEVVKQFPDLHPDK